MSETLSYAVAEASEPDTVNAGTVGFGSEYSAHNPEEKKSTSWERDDLTPLVQANAHIHVRCSWMPGAPVTVGEAMNSYPGWGSVTEETQDIAISAVLELLANRVEETEETAEEEDRPEEEAEPEKSEQDKKEERAEARQDKPAKTEDKKPPVQVKEPTQKNQLRPAPRKVQPKPAAAKVPESAKGEIEISKAADIAPGIIDQPDIPQTDKTEPELPPAAILNSQESAPAVIEAPAEHPKSAMENAGAPAPEAAELPAAVDTPEVPVPASIADAPGPSEVLLWQADEDPAFPPESGIAEEPEAPELPDLSSAIEAEDIGLADIAAFADEMVEAAEQTPELVVSDEAVVLIDLDDPAEEVFLINHFAAADAVADFAPGTIPNVLEPEQPAQAVRELGSQEEAEVIPYEQPVKLSLPIEEIEASLAEITERIEAGEPEVTASVNEILDKIIEIPARLESDGAETITTEAEAQAELEELFSELLDGLGIEYTPELVESLARLTLHWQLADEIGRLKVEAAADEAPQDSGTHEIIKKLLAGISFIKKALAQARTLGGSALRLYSFSFANT